MFTLASELVTLRMSDITFLSISDIVQTIVSQRVGRKRFFLGRLASYFPGVYE